MKAVRFVVVGLLLACALAARAQTSPGQFAYGFQSSGTSYCYFVDGYDANNDGVIDQAFKVFKWGVFSCDGRVTASEYVASDTAPHATLAGACTFRDRAGSHAANFTVRIRRDFVSVISGRTGWSYYQVTVTDQNGVTLLNTTEAILPSILWSLRMQ